ncbi:prolyl oligopeptidase family serine peptidase [Phenylobacterium sp.]|uniref:prolyl oligopeptidase family serine peptidase n=1 Tax=Phenylobacterium sp. TaxID=1871053 RepID=UPI003983BCDA
MVALLEDVKGAVDVYDLTAGRWSARRLPLPKDANITLVDTAGHSEELFATVESFLEPTSLWLADAARGRAAEVKALPARFAASNHVVEQFWATSTDGTKIPYFLVRPKAIKADGSLPTLMYGYGGFEVAKPPVYLPEMGKLWLARGGAYVIANIRGGGEFGPAWHQSVLREKRQLAFDDFAAVARDLSARKITSARRLGIYGRSNGGVLTTVAMTQHPELWNAVVVESPLVDMLRYHKLSAGASWVGEYGDPDVAADRAFIARYSGYQNLKARTAYPEAYITTNTRDDRVHPGHARKYAARLEALGVPYLYYEQTFGGHANDADPELNAGRWARHYVYLAQKLMD